MGLSFINGLAVGAALAVLITMVGVGDPPARHARLLSGRNIDKFHVPRPPPLGRRRRRREPVSGSAGAGGSSAGPGPSPLGALALLVVLAFPVTHLRLGNPDAGNDPKGTTTPHRLRPARRRASGPGTTGRSPSPPACRSPPTWPWCSASTPPSRADPGVASVGPVVHQQRRPIRPPPSSRVTPKTSPQAPETATSVRHLRARRHRRRRWPAPT